MLSCLLSVRSVGSIGSKHRSMGRLIWVKPRLFTSIWDTAKDTIDEFLVALEPDCGRAVTNGRPQRPIVRGTCKCALQSYFRLGFDKPA